MKRERPRTIRRREQRERVKEALRAAKAFDRALRESKPVEQRDTSAIDEWAGPRVMEKIKPYERTET